MKPSETKEAFLEEMKCASSALADADRELFGDDEDEADGILDPEND